jgi:quinol monooxygenase YgiN
MIGIIATLRAQAGKEAELEAVFGELSAQVRANEPGNILYRLTRVRADAGAYKVLELYRSDEDLKAHASSAHFHAAGPKLAGCLAEAPSIEYLDVVS